MAGSESLIAAVHIVAFTDWDEFSIRSVWTTAERANTACDRLKASHDGPGVYSVYEYVLDTDDGETE